MCLASALPSAGFSPRFEMRFLISSSLLVLTLATAPATQAVGTSTPLTSLSSPGHEDTPPDKETLRVLTEAEKNSPFNNSVLRQIAKAYQTEILCMIAKQYWQLAAEAGAKRNIKEERLLTDCSLGYGIKAVNSNPDSALAHAVLAICYAHSAELESPQKKIAYSKLVRSESEKSLQLDPRQDIALHVLGAWNYSMATLNPLLKSIVELVYGRLPDASLKSSTEYFQRASQVAPTRMMHKAALAKTYAAMGEREKALKTLAAAEALPSLDKEDAKILNAARLAVKNP